MNPWAIAWITSLVNDQFASIYITFMVWGWGFVCWWIVVLWLALRAYPSDDFLLEERA